MMTDRETPRYFRQFVGQGSGPNDFIALPRVFENRHIRFNTLWPY